MKKIVLGAMFACTNYAVWAQSSIAVFGVVDAGLSRFSNRSDRIGSGGTASALAESISQKRTELRNSGISSSRIGFRGVEDLGAGLSASFWLESPLNNDDGGNTLSFSRRSTVSVSGPFGEVRLGRDYTPTFWNDSNFHPFGTNGAGASLIAAANNLSFAGASGGFGGNAQYARASNSIGYFLPRNLDGLYGQVMYALHESTTGGGSTVLSPPAGRYAGGRAGYVAGDFDIAVAYGRSAGAVTTIRSWNIGSTYDMKFMKLFGEYANTRSEPKLGAPATVAAETLTGYTVGLNVPVGVGLIRAAYARVEYDRVATPGSDPSVRQLSLGYIHNLSKRTALYATVAHMKNSSGAGLTVGGPAFFTGTGSAAGLYRPGRSQGYEIGVRHTF